MQKRSENTKCLLGEYMTLTSYGPYFMGLIHPGVYDMTQIFSVHVSR